MAVVFATDALRHGAEIGNLLLFSIFQYRFVLLQYPLFYQQRGKGES